MRSRRRSRAAVSPDAFLEKTKDALTTLVARHARTHGPFVAADLAARWNVGEASIVTSPEKLIETGKGHVRRVPTRGACRTATEYIATPEVLRAIKQKTLARLRKAIEPVDAATFARFLCEWQNVRAPQSKDTHGSLDALYRALTQLEGCPLPASVLERDVLPARVPGYASHMLDQLLASGEIVWAGIEPIGPKDGRIALYFADREALLGATFRKMRSTRRFTMYFAICLETSRSRIFPGDRAIARRLSARSDPRALGSPEGARRDERHVRATARALSSRRATRSAASTHAVAGASVGAKAAGRFVVRAGRKFPPETERDMLAAIARSLLERYGVVLREAPSAEVLTGGFANVYDVYRAMEDQARVRRGYLAAGRGATQFALPGAEERLRASASPKADAGASEGSDEILILAATDPANAYGALLPWPQVEGREGRSAQRAPGARVILSRGRLLAWPAARGGEQMLTVFGGDETNARHDEDILARAIIELSKRRKKASILKLIDGAPAPEHSMARALAAVGFCVTTRRACSAAADRSKEAESFQRV